MVIRSEDIVLRPLSDRDVTAMLALLSDSTTGHMTVGFPSQPDENNVRALIEMRRNWEKNGTGWQMAIEYKGSFAGIVGVNAVARHHNRAALDYAVSPEFRGMGIAGKAVKAFLPAAVERFSLHRISASAFADNIPSGRVLEKCGFILEGIFRDELKKDGYYRDVAHYGLIVDG